MAEKLKFVVILEWDTNQRDFVQVDQPRENSIYIVIDEEQEKIIQNFPANTSLITRRTIERRIKSIAKSGFEIIDKRIRVGMNFELVETGSDTVIPDILLQVGHHYVGLDEKAGTGKSKTRKVPKPEKLITEPSSRDQEPEEPTPLPPPRVPVKRRKRHMIKPTFSGSPIKRKEVKTRTLTIAEIDEPVESEITPPVINQNKIAMKTPKKEDSITRGLGAMLNIFMEESESVFITKRGDSEFLLETGSNLVEFRLIDGFPEFQRFIRSSKKSFNIKELEIRLKEYL